MNIIISSCSSCWLFYFGGNRNHCIGGKCASSASLALRWTCTIAAWLSTICSWLFLRRQRERYSFCFFILNLSRFTSTSWFQCTSPRRLSFRISSRLLLLTRCYLIQFLRRFRTITIATLFFLSLLLSIFWLWLAWFVIVRLFHDCIWFSTCNIRILVLIFHEIIRGIKGLLLFSN